MIKKLIIVSAFASLATITACNNSKTEEGKTETADTTKTVAAPAQSFNLDTTKLASGTKFYQCEMHLEVLSDAPGNCPKCEMELSEIIKH
jgi:hypothetical protein